MKTGLPQLVLAFALSLIGLVGCGAPPRQECVPGIYLLDLDNRVRLDLYAGKYTLTVASDEARGTYKFDATDATIVFQPVSGGVSESSLRMIHTRVGLNGVLDAALRALASGHTAEAYDISQDRTGAVYITIDLDGANFVKKSCR